MTSSTQSFRRDLKGLAADLKWSAVELVRIAERLSHAGNEPDAQALFRMIKMLQHEELKVSAIVEDIGLGLIVRTESASI